MKRYLFVIFVIALTAMVKAAGIDTRTQTFDSKFKTLQVALEGNEFFPPIINMDDDSRVCISFDELADDVRYMRYRLVHCNSDWQPSQLLESEYVDGFNESKIEDCELSSGTFVNYVHYRLSVPNNDMRIKVSGNYLVQVYDEDNPDEVLLQARFMASENTVGVYQSVTTRTDIDYNASHQQLTVRVASKTEDGSRMDWHNDVKAVITQNMRTDNSVTLTRPNLIESDAVVYQHTPQLIFPAGNEFRRFETVSVRYAGMRVRNVELHEPYYHVELFTDQSRANEPYVYDRTQYGRYKVRQSDVLDSNTDAEYVIVHFSLATDQMQGGTFHIDGDFTHHIFDRTNALLYNPSTGLYEKEMLLKMGSYNYQYLWVPNDSMIGYTAVAEGDKFQTVNEYMCCVYRRSPGERFDRLLGFGIVYSGK